MVNGSVTILRVQKGSACVMLHTKLLSSIAHRKKWGKRLRQKTAKRKVLKINVDLMLYSARKDRAASNRCERGNRSNLARLPVKSTRGASALVIWRVLKPTMGVTNDLHRRVKAPGDINIGSSMGLWDVCSGHSFRYRRRRTRNNRPSHFDIGSLRGCGRPEKRQELLESAEMKFRKCISYDPTDGRAYVGLAKLIERAGRLARWNSRLKRPDLYPAHCEFPNLVVTVLDAAPTVVYGRHVSVSEPCAELRRSPFDPPLRKRSRGECTRRARMPWAVTTPSSGRCVGPPINPFIWQVGSPTVVRVNKANRPTVAWATLEAKLGNLDAARKLFDAATVADKSHAAAWHGWGMLEKREGNLLRARDLFVKGTKLAPSDRPNEYLFQVMKPPAAPRHEALHSRLADTSDHVFYDVFYDVFYNVFYDVFVLANLALIRPSTTGQFNAYPDVSPDQATADNNRNSRLQRLRETRYVNAVTRWIHGQTWGGIQCRQGWIH
eukprot:6897965-Pyramimonas_sp.AAC.1